MLKNLNKILERQNPDASFSIDGNSSLLYSAFILFLLNKENTEDELRQKIAEFLLKEKSENWTFNYWSRQHTQAEQLVPDDLFTSALAWLALYEYNPEIFDAEALAQITQSLTFLEINEGGPYRNWLVAENSDVKWLDIKFASNFLLAEFLKALDIELENLNEYLNKERFLAEEYFSEDLIKFFQKEKLEGNEYFWQFPNNEKFVIDLNLEEINLEKNITDEKNPKLISEKEEKIIAAIKNKVQTRLEIAGPEISNAIKPILEYILSKEKAILEILLLPYIFSQSFEEGFSEELLIDLGAANLWGWLAYTIYDDFLDDEGKIEQLSGANLALRELSQIFNNLENGFPQKNILATFHEAMDTVDAANTWEVKNCRSKITNDEFILPTTSPDYQNFQNLHQRSIGHGLGPFTLALISGIKKDSEKFKNIYQFIKSYIIAKQLNDDINDFWEDLKNGQINSVVATVLIIWQKKYPNKNIIHLENDAALINEIFYQEIAAEVLNKIIEESQVAQKSLKNFNEKAPALLFKIIEDLQSSAAMALKAKTENEKFWHFWQK